MTGRTRERQTGDEAALSRLRSRIDEQKALLQELAVLAVSQRTLVERSDAVGLLSVLAERQTVIERLARATEAGARDHEAWLASGPSGPSRREVQRCIDEIGEFHQRLSQGDERDQAAMRRSHEQMSLELSGLTQGQRAMNAYAPGPSAGARFHDTKG